MNTALQNSPEEDTHLIFLNLVDSMTSWHLNLFLSIDDEWSWKSFKGDPDSPENSYVVSACPIIEGVFPELRGRRDFYDHILKDLANSGLLYIRKKDVPYHSDLVWQAIKATPLGVEFRRLISDPTVAV
jgi:hypothetical protein